MPLDLVIPPPSTAPRVARSASPERQTPRSIIEGLQTACSAKDVPQFKAIFDEWLSHKIHIRDLFDVMWHAVEEDMAGIVSIFLAHGLRVTFIYAVKDEEMTRWLLDCGAEPNRQCKIDLTPLSWAVEDASLSTIQLLFGRGADVHKGEPLHHAINRLYSLEDTIRDFFQETPTTQPECDKAAAKRTGSLVHPVPIQGSFSYTVFTDDGKSIVQFRKSASVVDMDMLALAKRIYDDVVPACAVSGVIGLLTMFFANPWLNRLSSPHAYKSSYALSDLHPKLTELIHDLPVRFTLTLTSLLSALPSISTASYPLTLNHTDLCQMNIMVDLSEDKDKGGTTGVIDWTDAQILPFGFSLWGMYNMLGIMNSKGWTYYDNYEELERVFWERFFELVGDISDDEKERIRVAERVRGDLTPDIERETKQMRVFRHWCSWSL
ncbi:hypothetical protein BJX70DRAFT_393535 [Aspergillus crustosus]